MVTSAVWTASAASGFFLGLSLIVAIGAQNAFVLRQGLRREHVLAVVAICALSDLVLIVLGIAGAGIVFEQLPWLVEVVRWVGAAFLVTYGALAARRAIRPSPQALVSDQRTGGTPLLTAVATCLALTWLNPHVYLDTLVLLGSVGSTHGDARWAFGAGAGVASILWFAALGFGARMLAPLFARPLAWRILDGIIAVVMFAIAIALVLPALFG
jgi:L-lysine exporter family protein LysE/ArgO